MTASQVFLSTSERRLASRVEASLCLAVVLAAHAAILLGLPRLDWQPNKEAEALMVELIAPPKPLPQSASQPPREPIRRAPINTAPNAEPRPKSTPQMAQPARPAPAPIAAEPTPPAAASPPEAPPAPAVSRSTVPIQARPAAPATAASEPVATSKPAATPVPPQFDAAYLNNPRPEYPRLARRMGEQGKVLLRVYVGVSGNAEKVELQASSGSPRLDQAALEAVARWKFIPARQGEEPVAAWVLVPVTFVLEG